MSNKRILMFTMGNWSHSNGAIVRAMQSKLPQWEIIVIDLLQEFKKNKRSLLACVQDIPLLAWHSLQEGKFDRTNVLHAPATAAYINRLAHKLTREYQPAFTMQTTTRFNAGGGEVPHFTVIDSTLASVRQRYRELFNSSERSLDRLHAFQQRVYDSSTGIFTMGRYVRDSLVRDYHVAPHRAVAIGAGPNIVLGKRSNVVGSQDVLFVGTNWERKGGPPLLEAFRRIRRKYPQARFNIIGSSPEISEPGVNVIGRVPREELHRYFSEARLFALPTIHEAFGIAFVEALHFGLPIIGTSIGAIPEFAEDGINGFTVEPDDVDGMARALDKLFGDDALALRFGEASYQRSKQFTWDYAGSLLCDKMLSLAGSDKPSVMRPVTRHVEQRLAS